MMEEIAMTRTIRFTSALAAALLLFGATSTTTAQTGEEIRFGFYGGVVYSLVGAGSMQLAALNDARFQENPNFADPDDLSDGQGLGPHFGAMFEYHSGSTLGMALKLGADVYVAEMEDQANGATFLTSINYFMIEPGLRLSFTDDFAVTAGPSMGILITGKYDYDPGADNNVPGIEGERIDGLNETAFGAYADFSYDIQVRGDDEDGDTPIYLTPFLGVNWLTDQRGAASATQDELDDVWSTIGIRLGLQLKFGAML